MKLFSLSAACLVALAFVACDSKSEKSSEHESHDEAAVQDLSCPAAGESLGIHGDLSGYTAAAAGLFHVKVEWSSPLKASSLENKAKVTFVDEHAEALPLKLLGFKLFMPSMGHGTSKGDQLVLTQDSEEKHVWNVDRINFSMGGAANEWVVDVEAQGCDGTDKARVSIPVEVQ